VLGEALDAIAAKLDPDRSLRVQDGADLAD
jgi:hypothetical protein